jgi:hypothetical protein
VSGVAWLKGLPACQGSSGAVLGGHDAGVSKAGHVKNPLLQSIKETMTAGDTVDDRPRYTKSSRFAMIPAEILARKDLATSTKLVFAALRMESYGSGQAAVSCAVLAMLSGISRMHAHRGVVQLENKGLIEKDGPKLKQVQPYRILCDDVDADPAIPKEPTTLRRQTVPCAKCGRKCKSVGISGLCRECVELAELPAKVRQARIELGSTATPDQIAVHLKMRKLSARIRRILEAEAICLSFTSNDQQHQQLPIR